VRIEQRVGGPRNIRRLRRRLRTEGEAPWRKWPDVEFEGYTWPERSSGSRPTFSTSGRALGCFCERSYMSRSENGPPFSRSWATISKDDGERLSSRENEATRSVLRNLVAAQDAQALR